MSKIDLTVPDLGDFGEVAVIDVLVKVGDKVDVETPLVTAPLRKYWCRRAARSARAA